MPGVATSAGGHTFAWNVFIPGAMVPMLFFGALYLYPFFEQWASGDRRYHHVLDRPRNAPTRCGIGAAVIAMAIVLQLAAGDDVISDQFHVDLFGIVWVLRVAFFALPLAGFWLARHTCLALQQRDQARLAHGLDKGTVQPLPGGGFGARATPVPAERLPVLAARPPDSQIAWMPRHIVPLPTPRRVLAQVRARLNHFYTRYRRETPSGGPFGEQGRYEAALVRGPGSDGAQPEPPGLDGAQPEPMEANGDGHRELTKGREP
jgi:ubiquinol-cytochrome c reductase cytochrome b subunit